MVENSASGKRFDYNFKYVIPDHDWNYKLHNWAAEEGFLMFVRDSPAFREVMEAYKGNCKVIYSMWSGYLENKDTRAFLAPFDWEPLHTSGHATEETLRAVFEAVHPKKGVIPFHSENPDRLREVLGCPVFSVNDQAPVEL